MILRILLVAMFFSSGYGLSGGEEPLVSQPAPVVPLAQLPESIEPLREPLEIEVPTYQFPKREELPNDPPGAVELLVEPLSRSVLPYQAAIIRVSLVNR